MSPGALLEVAAGSILLLLSPNAPLQPLRKPLLGSNQPILSLWCFPASLSGTKSAFSIPNSPSAPRSKALPGSKPVILSPRVLPDGFAGSILAFLSPNIPLAPRSKAILGSRLPFLSPGVLHDGLPGSISPFLSPFDPADPLRKPFSGSKLCILIPQAFSGGACSGCRSGAGEVYTGAPPQTPAPLKPFPTLLRKVTGRGGPLMRTASARFKRSNMQASRCRSSPSAPLVPPQGPAEPSLAARTSISYYSPTRSQYRPRFQSGTTIKKKELPKDDSPNRRRSAAHQGAQFIQQLH